MEKKGLQLTGFREQNDEYGNTCHQPVYEEKHLSGAVFEVHAAENVIGKDGTLWYHADELVDTITTTAEGRDASRVLPRKDISSPMNGTKQTWITWTIKPPWWKSPCRPGMIISHLKSA